MVPVKGDELFRDWDEVFDKIYKRPKDGTIKKNHIFSISDDTIDTVILATKTSNHSSSIQTQQLIKPKILYAHYEKAHLAVEFKHHCCHLSTKRHDDILRKHFPERTLIKRRDVLKS